MTRQPVQSKRAAPALGPYSSAVWAGDLLYLSGQTPVDPSTGELIAGGIEAQTHRCFDNLELVITDAGLSMDNVIKCNVYLTDMGNFTAMNAAYSTRFKKPYPARTTVAVKALPRDALVEIEMIARRA
ncbi:MAG TPA: RidA family protein [Gemmatimonadaceae bacterium]|nr:RidA family protein [Gemmatimonadaceae bacterium]